MRRLNWGMVGGGEGSQIGPAHRMGAMADGHFFMTAGALDHNPEAGRAYAQTLGIEPDRAYGNWKEMLAGERKRDDRIDLVTVATPNATHYEITKAFLDAGFHVLCEKPMTMTVEEGEDIVRTAQRSERICAVNYAYSAYPMIRHMRHMVSTGDLGAIRCVVANFSHGHHAAGDDADNPRVRWRYDPAQAGVSGQMADCGIHAMHLASFVIGDEVETLAADFASCVSSRKLEDDAMINFRTAKGAVGRLWTSTVALGRQHGLDIQVFGEKGGLRWASEHPNQAFWTPLGGRTEVIEKGEAGISDMAARLSRVPIAHPEGFPLAVANIYVDLAEAIWASKAGTPLADAANHFPKAEDGLRSMAAVYASVESAKNDGKWVDARPPMFR